jgi:hypothetical protein
MPTGTFSKTAKIIHAKKIIKQNIKQYQQNIKRISSGNNAPMLCHVRFSIN